ncbi:unnamed protein product [Victoria cruziana]
MSGCGGNCGCGSTRKCGGGCKMLPEITFAEEEGTAELLIFGVAPLVGHFNGVEMVEGGHSVSEGCKCGKCGCDPCTCK